MNLEQQEPVTNEYAAKRLHEALASGNDEEAKKWALCIQANNEMRIHAKHRERRAKERALERKRLHSYRLT